MAATNHPDPESRPEQGDTQEEIASSLRNIAATYNQEAKRAQRPNQETEPCKPGDERRYSDLCAQWKAADAAADSAWWAWAGGVIGFLSLGGVLVALALAFHSNWIARDTARRQLRAYLSFSEIIFNPEHGDHKIQIKWVNRGQTPAVSVEVYAKLISSPEDLPNDFGFPQPEVFDEGPASIGPGGAILAACDRELRDVDLEGASLGLLRIYLWGAVNYVDVFGIRRRTETAIKCDIQPLRGEEQVVMRWITIHHHNGMDEGCMHPPQNAQ